MATSSITANFYCTEAKAANTFVDLQLSENPPAKWTAPAPTGAVHEIKGKREIRSAVQRIVRARRGKVHA